MAKVLRRQVLTTAHPFLSSSVLLQLAHLAILTIAMRFGHCSSKSTKTAQASFPSMSSAVLW